VLNPLVHFGLAEASLVVLPVSACDVAVDQEGRVVAVEFELAGWNVQKLESLEQLIIGGNELLEGLVLWRIAVSVENDGDVLGLYLLQKLILLFDHERC
jgi:hypothetical protein